MRAWILALFGLLGFAAPAPASLVLQELHRVHVRVEQLPELVVEANFDEERIHRDVALALGQPGLVVLSALRTEVEGPAVVVTIDAVETPYGAVAYHASMELQEDVALVRAPDTIAVGSVWYTSTFGIAQSESLVEEIEGMIGALVESFLRDAGLQAP